MEHTNYEVGEVIETNVYRKDASGHNSILICLIVIMIAVGGGFYLLGRRVGKKLNNRRK